jgi:hypothetical protein
VFSAISFIVKVSMLLAYKILLQLSFSLEFDFDIDLYIIALDD